MLNNPEEEIEEDDMANELNYLRSMESDQLSDDDKLMLGYIEY